MQCPVCKSGVTRDVDGFQMCRSCGAEQRINQITGNVIWMRGGRVVWAEKDVQEQYDKMVERNFESGES